MLLGALPIRAELPKRLLGLLYAVLTSENRCLQDVVQRQFSCSFDNTQSSFYIVAQVLDRYHLPTISQILTSSISKLKWKHTYKKLLRHIGQEFIFVENIKGIYKCPIWIIKGLTDKGQFQYLKKLKGPQVGNYLYKTRFLSLR